VNRHAKTRLILLLNQCLNHRATAITNLGSKRRLEELTRDYSLHILLPLVLVRNLIFHKLVKVSRANLLLLILDQLLRQVELVFFLIKLSLLLCLLVSNLLLRALFRIEVKSLDATRHLFLNAELLIIPFRIDLLKGILVVKVFHHLRSIPVFLFRHHVNTPSEVAIIVLFEQLLFLRLLSVKSAEILLVGEQCLDSWC